MNDLEYIDEIHTYLWEGVIIPSVSEILHFIFPCKYKNVPEIILQNKACHGTNIHGLIEMLEKGEILPKMGLNEEFSISEYLRLKEKYNIEVLDQEQMVCYKGKYAGRFDMLGFINSTYSLCDIKTTATLDEEYLSWQLSYYEMALNYMYPASNIDKLYVIWLPKRGNGRLVEVKRKSRKELEDKLKEYEEDNKYRKIGGCDN